MTSPDTRLPAARTRSFLKTAGIACALALPVQAAVTFSDSSFADFGGNYTVTNFTTGNGGTQTPSYQSSGGNPGEFLTVSNSIAASTGGTASIANIFMIRNGASYTPAVSGAITSLDFSINLIKLAGSPSLIVNASPGIVQGGKFYFWAAGLTNGTNSWTTPTKTGLVASDFAEAISGGSSHFNASSHPDFTNGSTIQFGISYPTGGAVGAAAFTTQAGFDNWSTTITTVPEVSSSLLGVVGACGLLAVRRRGTRSI